MSLNKFMPHVYVIPEDHADEQIANGFVLHDQVKQNRIRVEQPAGGWLEVLHKFKVEYIAHLQKYEQGHVIMLIDFDGKYDSKRTECEQAIPDELKQRVFVVGPKKEPEDIRREMGKNFEQIGFSLADDCFARTETIWSHEQLKHNDPDRQRLVQTVKPILFGTL